MVNDITAHTIYSDTEEPLELARGDSDCPEDLVCRDSVKSTMPSNDDRLLDGAAKHVNGQIDTTMTSYAARNFYQNHEIPPNNQYNDSDALYAGELDGDPECYASDGETEHSASDTAALYTATAGDMTILYEQECDTHVWIADAEDARLKAG